MTRLNIEERAFGEGRLDNLAEALDWHKAQALGHLAFLWHDSQAKLRTKGADSELIAWARVKKADGPRFIAALLEHGYVDRKDDGEIEIHGTEEQIEACVAGITKAHKGGEGTKRRWEKIKADKADRLKEEDDRRLQAFPKHSLEPATSPPLASSEHASELTPTKLQPRSIQCKAMQGNARQCKASMGMSDSASDDHPMFGPRELAALWNAHCGPMHPKVDPKRMKHGTPRWRQAEARLKEDPDPAYWEEVVRRFVAWPHGRGETPGKDGSAPWIATFDFLLKPQTHVRAMEGQFERRQTQPTVQPRQLHAPRNTPLRVDSIEELEKLVR